MVISTDCAHYEEVIRAYHRLLDLRDKHVDLEVLSILVKAVTSDMLDNYDRPASKFYDETLKLFGRLTSQISTEGRIWELYADLALFGLEQKRNDQDPVKIGQFMQKANACFVQKSGWEREVDKSKDVLKVAAKYASGN